MWIQEMPKAPRIDMPMMLLVNTRGRVVEVPATREKALKAKGFVDAPKGASKNEYLKDFDSALKKPVEETVVVNAVAPTPPTKKATSKKTK